MQTSISSKFIHAISYTALTSVVARFFGVTVTVLIARFLSSSELGLYTIILSTLGLFSTFVSCGQSLAATKMMAEYYTNDPQKAGRIFSLLFLILVCAAFVGIILYWFSVPFIAQTFSTNSDKLISLLRMSVIWLLITIFCQYFESVLIGLQGFKSFLFVQSIYGIVNLPIIVCALLLSRANLLTGLIIGSTIVSFLQLFVLVSSVFKEFKKYSIKISILSLGDLVQSVLIDFSFPAFITKLFEQPMSWLSILLLTRLGGSLSYVGGLSVITSIRTWILYFPSMVSNIMLPIFTDIYATRDKSIFEKTLIYNQRFIWLSTLPVICFSIVIIKHCLRLVFGETYEIYWLAAAIMLGASVLLPINEVNDKAMFSMNKIWLSISFRLIYLLLFLVLLFIYVPKLNLLGYVIAWSISYLIYVSIQHVWLRFHTKSNLDIHLFLFSMIAVSLAGILSRIENLSNCILTSLFLSLFVLIYEYLYLLSTEERTVIFSLLKKLMRK